MIEYIPETNEIIMSKNDFLKFDNGYYKYIGKVQRISEVPQSNCLFVMDECLYIRRIDLEKFNRLKATNSVVKEVDDSDELDLEIKPGDDSTLVIVKELLKGFTKNSFRKLFDNDSDMNNMKNAIEKSSNGQLSLNRFRTILDKLHLKYKIIVFSDELDDKDSYMEEKIKKINDRTLYGRSHDDEEDKEEE
jgi:hypothetical protein